MNHDDLRNQYEAMTYEKLTELKNDAVLSAEVINILDEVLSTKKPGETPPKIKQQTSNTNIGAPIETRKESYVSHTENPPLLSSLFNFLAALGMLSGVFLFMLFWPNDSIAPIDKTVSYSISIAWLMAGIIEAALFSAIELGLKYLKATYINTKHS